MQVSQSYGLTRPAAIAAKVAALQARCFCAPRVAEVTLAPVLALVPAAQPKAEVAAYQAERAAIRADLPMLRAAAIDAAYLPIGAELIAEIATLESRLADLEDYLIFEPDFAAQTFDASRFAA